MNQMNQHDKLDFVIKQNTYMLGLLENNEKTGQKGAIKRLDDVESRVGIIETKDSVRVGKATLLGGFVGGIIVPGLWWVGKIALKLIV